MDLGKVYGVNVLGVSKNGFFGLAGISVRS